MKDMDRKTIQKIVESLCQEISRTRFGEVSVAFVVHGGEVRRIEYTRRIRELPESDMGQTTQGLRA